MFTIKKVVYICKVNKAQQNLKTRKMKANSLTQMTKKEQLQNRLSMFQNKVVEFSKLISQARYNNNTQLENIYIEQLMQCEKMIQISKTDLINL